jgi:hypothetical protein
MWKQIIRNDKKKRVKKERKNTEKAKKTMYRRKCKLLLPGSWMQKEVFSKFHYLGKRRGVIK